MSILNPAWLLFCFIFILYLSKIMMELYEKNTAELLLTDIV
ncbi:hypothetical protein J655_1463 [Acinetobacter sp. 1294243]|nr:hypothetical protein J655_1463 [Acinetobacter sp. 1294243]